MKAIQFKKTNHYTGNHDEVTGMLGGTVVYVGQRGNTETIKSYERDNQAFPLQFDDWIVDIDGVIIVLSDVQYQALISKLSTQKSLGDAIGEAVRNVIKKEQGQGGLLSK